ncbi:MAG: hypothetical protein KI790_13915 [Cyclobacteriaceae bacterium]|nr:hypothetical protein [Cyclobacteriaceae bacterium HetDA_MAG_MS6]
MNKLNQLILAFGFLLLISSCGVSGFYVRNQNQNSTQVHLSSDNFNIVDKVSGSSEVTYVLIFGGASRKQLYENAYAKMVDDARLTGPRALVNVLTEEHLGGVPPFYYKRTITVSAHVVEFSE